MIRSSLLPGRRTLFLAISSLFIANTHAQSTTGSIAGQAPIASGETVLVQSDTGLTREVQVDDKGRYVAGQLPLGTYTVTLRRDGSDVQKRSGITLKVGASVDVTFNSEAASLDAVHVTGTGPPSGAIVKAISESKPSNATSPPCVPSMTNETAPAGTATHDSAKAAINAFIFTPLATPAFHEWPVYRSRVCL